MDKTILYTLLDIDDMEEFVYYENMQALLEEDEYIEEELIRDIVTEVDIDVFKPLMDDYFEELLKDLPDEDTDIYITTDSIHRIFAGLFAEDIDEVTVDRIASEIMKFRKWYVQDSLVYDIDNENEINVRDARYNVKASKMLGDKYNYDFRMAYLYDSDGYDVRVSDIVSDAFDEENDID